MTRGMRLATPLGAEETSPTTGVLWDMAKIIALAGGTAYLVHVILKGFSKGA